MSEYEFEDDVEIPLDVEEAAHQAEQHRLKTFVTALIIAIVALLIMFGLVYLVTHIEIYVTLTPTVMP